MLYKLKKLKYLYAIIIFSFCMICFPSGSPFIASLRKFTVVDNPYKYSSYHSDIESGLYCLKARYYSPELMLFISQDTYDLSNRYAYCDGNPIGAIDPSGHIPISTSITMAAAAANCLAICVEFRALTIAYKLGTMSNRGGVGMLFTLLGDSFSVCGLCGELFRALEDNQKDNSSSIYEENTVSYISGAGLFFNIFASAALSECRLGFEKYKKLNQTYYCEFIKNNNGKSPYQVKTSCLFDFEEQGINEVLAKKMKIRELKVGNAIKQSSYVFSYSDKGVTREILISARSNNNGEFRGQYFETAFHMALIKDPNQTFHSFALAYAPSNAELFGNATFLNSYASYLNEEKILNIESASKETISWIKEQYINEIRAW